MSVTTRYYENIISIDIPGACNNNSGYVSRTASGEFAAVLSYIATIQTATNHSNVSVALLFWC